MFHIDPENQAPLAWTIFALIVLFVMLVLLGYL